MRLPKFWKPTRPDVLKRIFDLVIATPLLLACLPVIALCAFLIRLETPGPVLFRQVRVGRYGRHFHILKLRTMVAASSGAGSLITSTNDRRVTFVGRWLRRTKLDELPQLINVLLGDMSLVGPRPEVPKYVELYPSDARDVVFSVRPGITDEASIVFRDEGDLLAAAADPEHLYVTEILPRKLALYVKYAREHTLATDLRILIQTLMVVLRPERPHNSGL